MEEYQIKLRFNFGALTDSETGFKTDDVIDYLWAHYAVSEDQRQEIRAERTTRRQAERLIEYLVDNGEGACRSLYKALKETYPHFAELLDNTPPNASDKIYSGSRKVVRNKGSNLPALSTVLVGRDDYQQRFMSWLQANDTSKRLYVFTGCPGIGKTSMMIKILHEHELNSNLSDESSSEGIIFIDLSCVRDVESVANRLIHILDPSKNESRLALIHTEDQARVGQLCDYFRKFGRRFVLAFDNAEDGMIDSLRDTFLGFIEEVLQSSPNVRIVMASRVSVTSLSTAYIEEILLPLKEDQGKMLCLYLLPGVDEDSCMRLAKLTAGLPLAIVLMAVQMKRQKNFEDVISALEESPGHTLSFIGATVGMRKRALLSQCFGSVFSRLSEVEKHSLISCSVFPYSFDRASARYVLYKDATETSAVQQTFLVLRSLEAMSMLTFDANNYEYRIHPLLRTYCHNKRTECERQRTEHLFCEYYVNLTVINMKEKTHTSAFLDGDDVDDYDAVRNLVYAFQLCRLDKRLSRSFLPMANVLGLVAVSFLPEPIVISVFTSLLHSLQCDEQKERVVVLSMLAPLTDESTSELALKYTQEAEDLLAVTDRPVCDITLHTFILLSKAIVYLNYGQLDNAESTFEQLLMLWEPDAVPAGPDIDVLLNLTCHYMLCLCGGIFMKRLTRSSFQLFHKTMEKARLYKDPKVIDNILDRLEIREIIESFNHT